MYFGRRRVRLDLLAQRADQHAQVLRLIDRVRAPDGLEDGAVGQHPAGMLRQERQQLEFLRRQPHFFAVPEHPESLAVDDQVAAHDRLARRRRRLDAPQRRADAGQQLLGAERLGDVVVGAGVERAHLVAFGAARREHQDRHARRLAHAAADLDAVDIRQARGRGRSGPACRARPPRAPRGRSSRSATS